MDFNKNILNIDCREEVARIAGFLREQVIDMKKDGIVIGISGGVDSALAAALTSADNSSISAACLFSSH